MKVRFSSSLLSALLPAMTGAATAATLYPSEILDVAAGETVTWENFDNMQGGNAYSPFVKDGAGTLVLQNIEGSRTNCYKAPLVAREGKVEIKDSTIYAHGAYVPSGVFNESTGVSTWIMVGGKDAEMSFSNSSFNIATGETHMNIGTADGNGTLTLDNKSTMSVCGSIFTGYHSYANNEDKWGLGYVYNWNGTAATVPTTSPSGDDNKSISSRYTEGTYVDGYNGQNRKFGKGTINVLNGSSLNVATLFQMGTSTLNVDNSTVEMNTGFGGIVSDDSAYVETYALIMGRWSGAESEINITNGGKITTYGQLRTQRSNGLVNTKSVINVKGEGSELEVKATANLGIYDGDGSNSTTVNVTEGGKVSFGKTNMGTDNVTVNVDAASSFVSNELNINAGLFDSNGTVEVSDINLNGGTFIAGDGASIVGNDGEMMELVATGGQFVVGGSIDVQGDITLGNTEFVFADGSVIDLNGGDFTLGDGCTIKVLMSAAQPMLLTSDTEGSAYEIQGITFNNAGVVTGFDGDITISLVESLEDTEGVEVILSSDKVVINSASIPEPTTATLSLLALAALAARRRR